ncbi:hypothetical protein AOQ84DRAFT_377152 [Glonium stellatum]|uniref:Uncharacterized protein n=1 Tax=Glonium stellatum TaxID=574774 RepID=A0A8E2JSL8_9PEZI|nr:hypothetical protein AOQ84DRAFT_377152 [Glonium stellatum]
MRPTNKVTPWTIPPSLTKPVCETYAAGRCTIDRASIDLYYSPVTRNFSRNMCAKNPVSGPATKPPKHPNSKYVPITIGPYSVLSGHTFYSGNVYISIATASAHGPCGGNVGQIHYGSILTLASTDVQSMRGYPLNNIPWSFNYADLNPPIPYR